VAAEDENRDVFPRRWRRVLGQSIRQRPSEPACCTISSGLWPLFLGSNSLDPLDALVSESMNSITNFPSKLINIYITCNCYSVLQNVSKSRFG
jgi:hypothetical protein